MEEMDMDAPPLSFTKIAVLARANHERACSYARELASILRGSKNFSYARLYDQDAELIILAGGDGFALHALKKYGYLGAPFLGISFGDVGFFMNPVVEPTKLLEMLAEASAHFISQTYPLLEITYRKSDAEFAQQTALAFNEVVLERVHGQTLRLDIGIGGEKLNTFSGDALMMSTPQGTTGYAINTGVGAPAVHPNVLCTILTPVNPQKSWKYRSLLFPIALPPEIPVNVRVLESAKRPAHIVCDGVSMGNVSEISVHMARHTVSVLSFSDPSFRTSYVAKLVDKIIGPPRDMA